VERLDGVRVVVLEDVQVRLLAHRHVCNNNNNNSGRDLGKHDNLFSYELNNKHDDFDFTLILCLI
jgi:hypothetical protein